MRILAVLAICMPLGACAVAAKVDARNEYRDSAEKYKQCLAANTTAPQRCEGLRLALEADERKYVNLTGGLNPGSLQSTNIQIQSR